METLEPGKWRMEHQAKIWYSPPNVLHILNPRTQPQVAIQLTYGMWATTLIGLNHFRLVYPDLAFTFYIYVTTLDGKFPDTDEEDT